MLFVDLGTGLVSDFRIPLFDQNVYMLYVFKITDYFGFVLVIAGFWRVSAEDFDKEAKFDVDESTLFYEYSPFIGVISSEHVEISSIGRAVVISNDPVNTIL